MTMLLLTVWGLSATGLALYYRADAIWWRRQARDCHRLMGKAIPPAPAQLPPGEPTAVPVDGLHF